MRPKRVGRDGCSLVGLTTHPLDQLLSEVSFGSELTLVGVPFPHAETHVFGALCSRSRLVEPGQS